MSILDTGLDPKVLELVNAGVGALAVVIFFVTCAFAYPVVKKDNPSRSAIGLCKWMSTISVIFLLCAMIFLYIKPTGSARQVVVTLNPEDVVDEFNRSTFLRRGEFDNFLKGKARQSIEVRDRDQFDFHLDALYSAYQHQKLLAVQQQKLLSEKAQFKKGGIDIAN